LPHDHHLLRGDRRPRCARGRAGRVIGYGNQGRSVGAEPPRQRCAPIVLVRRDETREQAQAGTASRRTTSRRPTTPTSICIPRPDRRDRVTPAGAARRLCVIVASGTRSLRPARPAGRQGMVAPRMLGPKCAACYEEGRRLHHRDRCPPTTPPGARRACPRDRQGDRGLRQGGLSSRRCRKRCSTRCRAGALRRARSGEQLIRAAGMGFFFSGAWHPDRAIVGGARALGRGRADVPPVASRSALRRPVGVPLATMQYGQLTRRGRYDHLDFAATMRRARRTDIESGRFADECGQRNAMPATRRSPAQGATRRPARFREFTKRRSAPPRANGRHLVTHSVPTTEAGRSFSIGRIAWIGFSDRNFAGRQYATLNVPGYLAHERCGRSRAVRTHAPTCSSGRARGEWGIDRTIRGPRRPSRRTRYSMRSRSSAPPRCTRNT